MRLPNVREDWDALHQTLEGHNGAYYGLSFSSDSKLLASASEDGSIKLWNAATGVECLSSLLSNDVVRATAFSPDSKILALGSYYQTVRLWDAATGLERYNLKGHRAPIDVVTFSSDGNLLASGSRDNTIKLWDVSMGTELCTLRGHDSQITTIVFLPGDKLLASASKDKSAVKLWDVSAGIESHTRGPFDHYGDSVILSSDASLLATRINKIIRVWDTNTGDELKRPTDHEMASSIAISPDGKMLVSGSFETITIWDIASGGEPRKFRGHKGWVSCVIFSPDGKMLASASNDKTIKLWDATIDTRQEVSGNDHQGWVNIITFSPDGKLLASASHDNTVKLWDTVLGAGKKILGRHEAWVNDMAFSPDGRLLATAGDKSIKLWNLVTGEEQQNLTSHDEWVNNIIFSPDGKLLASISIDRTINLWDLVTGAAQRTIQGGKRRLGSPLSHSLVSGEATHVTFVNESYVDVMFFWLDMNGISKHYWTIGPHQQFTQPTFVGHFWRFVNASTNRAIGGFCGVPEHIKIIIRDEDIAAVEDNRQYLENAINRFHFWSTSSDVSRDQIQPSLAVDNNWVINDLKERLIWLPDEYRAICSACNQSTLALGHASGRLTFLEINSMVMSPNLSKGKKPNFP